MLLAQLCHLDGKGVPLRWHIRNMGNGTSLSSLVYQSYSSK